jgi:hypothetical protein
VVRDRHPPIFEKILAVLEKFSADSVKLSLEAVPGKLIPWFGLPSNRSVGRSTTP